MKKLIALAAVLGLAVSSWGLTPQVAPEAQMAPGATGVVIAEAQLGAYFGSAIYHIAHRVGVTTIYYDNFGWDGRFGGHLATMGGRSAPSSGEPSVSRLGGLSGHSSARLPVPTRPASLTILCWPSHRSA